MGWITYNLLRTNTQTGSEIGKINILFPKVAEVITVGENRLNTAQLLTINDFPIEAHIFTIGDGVHNFSAMGFGNIIDVSEYAGETWLLSNGAKIVITSDITSGSIKAFFPNGKEAASNTVYSDSAAYPPCYVGQDKSGRSPYATYYSGQFGGEIEFNDAEFPRYMYTVNFFDGVVPIVETDDPYDPGGETEPGGGAGDFDNTSDPVEIPPLPTLSAVDTGFITLFNPSLMELNNLARYMWSDLFSVDGWKKIFADPMQAILGLSIVPVDVPSTGTRPVIVGNISTDVSMTVASSQYVLVDCGTLNVNEFWGAYLDYDPYTKTEIYLPYIGIHALATDDVMSKPVHVVYHVDILSGACCAFVKCGDSVLYTFNGQCASSIPITGDNWTNVINGAITIAGAIGTMVATGGMSAPMGIGQIASTSVNTLKPSIEKSGSMGGTGGLMAIQTPYLILTRPRQAVPKSQNEFIGYPAYITEKLSDLSGYTEVESIHLENVPATANELSEIESLLKSGVIF